jgi:hypothetical protein
LLEAMQEHQVTIGDETYPLEEPFLVLATTFLVCCIAHSGPIFHAVSYALACGVPVLGCDLAGEPVYTLAALKTAVVVIGSEGRGLSPGVAAALTRRITIPRHGGAESLNAAVAAGIVCAALRAG